MTSPAKGLSDEKAARMMAALREGRTLRSFGVKAPRLDAYFAAHPYYAREARPLIVANAKAARLRKGARLGSRTHCRFGHPFSGDNLFLTPEGWRRCRICTEKSHAENRRMSEQQARRVVEALHEGKTIADITKSGRPSYILNHRALLLFRQKHPKFERFVVRLSTANAKVHHAEAWARRAQILRAPNIAAHGGDIFSLIRSAVPETLPRQIRDDVIGSMALEVVEGKLKTGDIRRRVREFITEQYRQFSRFWTSIAGCPGIRGRNDGPWRHDQPRAVGLDAPKRPERESRVTIYRWPLLPAGAHQPAPRPCFCEVLNLQARAPPGRRRPPSSNADIASLRA